jgi:tryptophan synthase beta chain
MYEYQQPDPTGHFGIYGGSFVSETLTHAINELREAYAKYQHDPEFLAEFNYELAHFVGRPSPDLPRRTHQPRAGWRPDLPQARGP